jgi:hypothetical protein
VWAQGKVMENLLQSAYSSHRYCNTIFPLNC